MRKQNFFPSQQAIILPLKCFWAFNFNFFLYSAALAKYPFYVKILGDDGGVPHRFQYNPPHPTKKTNIDILKYTYQLQMQFCV